MQIRIGQKWRDVRGGGSAAQIVTVDGVEGTTVHGSYTPEDAPMSIGTSAWSIDDVLQNMTLIHDPQWPAHRVVVECVYEGAPGGPVSEAMLTVGQKQGARSVQPKLGGGATAIAWWDVVAATEAEAIERARAALQHVHPQYADINSIRVDNSVDRTL